MDNIIKTFTAHNEAGKELRYELSEKDSGSKRFVFVAPGSFDRFYKTRAAAEKAFNKKTSRHSH